MDNNHIGSTQSGTTEALKILNQREANRLQPILDVSFEELGEDLNRIVRLPGADFLKDSVNRIKGIADSNEDSMLRLIKMGEATGSFILRDGKRIRNDPEVNEAVKIFLVDYLDTVSKTNNQDLISAAVGNVKNFLPQ